MKTTMSMVYLSLIPTKQGSLSTLRAARRSQEATPSTTMSEKSEVVNFDVTSPNVTSSTEMREMGRPRSKCTARGFTEADLNDVNRVNLDPQDDVHEVALTRLCRLIKRSCEDGCKTSKNEHSESNG